MQFASSALLILHLPSSIASQHTFSPTSPCRAARRASRRTEHAAQPPGYCLRAPGQESDRPSPSHRFSCRPPRHDGAALGRLDGDVLRWHVVRGSSEASLGAMHRLDASPTRHQGRERLFFIHYDRIALGCPSGGDAARRSPHLPAVVRPRRRRVRPRRPPLRWDGAPRDRYRWCERRSSSRPARLASSARLLPQHHDEARGPRSGRSGTPPAWATAGGWA